MSITHCIKDGSKIDPACGSGNFLTETYLSLRRLENEAIKGIMQGQVVLDVGQVIQVGIEQFYGIEINDFAATVAKTALWIAESQMMKETEAIVHMNLDFLPLKSYANIAEGNALRMDWDSVIPRERLDYIMGNPPFIGYTYQSAEQKEDIQVATGGIGKNVDFVAAWFYKAAQMMQGTSIRAAFVATNSITQGEQVEVIWKQLYEKYHIELDFAHRTFVWDSEANMKAHVHCVIIGFGTSESRKQKRIYEDDRVKNVEQINPYLMEGPLLFLTKRSKPICDVPEMRKGSQPTDGGNLIIEASEIHDFIRIEPKAKAYVKLYLGAEEFINAKKRYCLWLVDISPNELASMPTVLRRVRSVQEFRRSSKKEATRKWADRPTLFTENRQPDEDYIAVPEFSSERRKYIPMGFLEPDIICSNKLQLIPNATHYMFGVLMSNVHMAWMRAVGGKLKSDYGYSNTIVYNNFPWPQPSAQQQAAIEETARAILDARALYPDSSLADLYDEVTMPVELRKAHQANDRAVMAAYGFSVREMTESDCVTELMRMYQQLTDK